MNIDQAFPSKFLKAGDLQGKTVKLKMERVEWETIGTDRKMVLYFQGTDRGLVLNKTNANRISFGYGKETDNWVGKDIEVFPDMVDFQGRMVEAVRVRPPSKPAQSGFAQNGRQAPPPRRDEPPPPASEADYAGGGDIDDPIPFGPEWR